MDDYDGWFFLRYEITEGLGDKEGETKNKNEGLVLEMIKIRTRR